MLSQSIRITPRIATRLIMHSRVHEVDPNLLKTVFILGRDPDIYRSHFYDEIKNMSAGMPWTSYQISKIAGAHAPGMPGTFFPTYGLQSKPLVSDPDMHQGTCMMHVPWCMSGSLTRGGGEIVPGIPGACATRYFTYLARGPLGAIYWMSRGGSGYICRNRVVYNNVLWCIGGP